MKERKENKSCRLCTQDLAALGFRPPSTPTPRCPSVFYFVNAFPVLFGSSASCARVCVGCFTSNEVVRDFHLFLSPCALLILVSLLCLTPFDALDFCLFTFRLDWNQTAFSWILIPLLCRPSLILFALLHTRIATRIPVAQKRIQTHCHGDREADPVPMVTETGTVAEYPRTFGSEGGVERWAGAGSDNVNLPHRINVVCSSDGCGTLDSHRLNVTAFCACTCSMNP